MSTYETFRGTYKHNLSHLHQMSSTYFHKFTKIAYEKSLYINNLTILSFVEM